MLRLLDLLLLQAAVMFTAAPVAVRSQATLTPTVRTVAEDENAIFACSPLIIAASPFLNTIDPGSNQAEALISDSRLNFIDYPNGDPSANRTFIWLDTDRVENGRRFFCTISNTMSAESTLYINFAPDVTADRQDLVDVPLGSTLQLTCSLLGVPPPDSVTWTHNGTTLNDADSDITISSNATSTSLSRTNVADTGGGQYECSASNVVGSNSDSTEVRVQLDNTSDDGVYQLEPTIIEDRVDCYPSDSEAERQDISYQVVNILQDMYQSSAGGSGWTE